MQSQFFVAFLDFRQQKPLWWPGLFKLQSRDLLPKVPKVPVELQQNIFRALASMIFFMGNLSYLVASLILALLTLHAKLSGRQEATKRRPKVETCCSICSPYNGLTILHHLEHRCPLFPLTILLQCTQGCQLSYAFFTGVELPST